jgi:hypothetical protein
MSGKIDLHTEILSDAQENLLYLLSKVLSNTDFYLAGGTALALHIGHRPSLDFDWFISRIGDPEDLYKILKASNISYSVLTTSFETIYLNINSIQVSFIGYDYPMLKPPDIISSKYPFQIAGLDDIACMKLSAIASRGSRKDFVDLYFLVNEFRSLEEYLRLFMRKYKNNDLGYIIKSLVYFKDAEAEPELKVIKPLDWEKLKADFEEWVNNIRI